MDDDEVFKSLHEASLYGRVTRQAIYLGIKKGEIKAERKMVGNQPQWFITKKAIDDYRASKYDSSKRKVEGESVIDPTKNCWSVHQAAKALATMLNRPYPAMRIYYLLRSGFLRGKKKGGMWVLTKEELIKLYYDELRQLEDIRNSI